MPWPSAPADFLALDAEQQADLLLAGLLGCLDNERGRNFIHHRLHEWFYDLSSGVGNPRDFPRLQQQRQQATEALEVAYSLLESRALIRPDPRAGTTFCQVTPLGQAQVEQARLPRAARVTFARRALNDIELHTALRSRHVDTHFRQGKFETALRDGSTFLENSIRTVSEVDPRLVGVSLASTAFAPDTGRLSNPSASSGERAGLQSLYAGYFGAIRNVVSHNDFEYESDKEAFQALMLLDHLVEKLDEAAQRIGARLDE